jgi:hypothetical protein
MIMSDWLSPNPPDIADPLHVMRKNEKVPNHKIRPQEPK